MTDRDSGAKRDDLRAIEKRPHPFLGHGPLEFAIGVFVGREQIVPYDGRVLGVDDFERPPRFALKSRYRDPAGSFSRSIGRALVDFSIARFPGRAPARRCRDWRKARLRRHIWKDRSPSGS